MSFEKYNAKSSSGDEIYISFHNNSHMRLSTGFVKKYKAKAGFINLYYDGDTDSIGIEFLKEYEEGALKLSKRAGVPALSCCATGFIMKMGLEVEGRYKNIHESDGMIVVDLGGIK